MFNLVIVLIATFAFSLLLIYFIAAHDRRRAAQQIKNSSQSEDQTPAIDFRAFQKLCQDILEGLKLEIKDVSTPSGGEVVIRATSPNPITAVDYLVVGFHLPQQAELELARIIEVSDQIVSERIGKGIIMTTGQINFDVVRTLPELASIELIDGSRLLKLKEEYRFLY